MKPDPRFQELPKCFWAYVRSLSEHIGYTRRGSGEIIVPDLKTISDALVELGLTASGAYSHQGRHTDLTSQLLAYFRHRAHCLNDVVCNQLLDARQAEILFENTCQTLGYRPVQQPSAKKAKALLLQSPDGETLEVPMNKQKGTKKKPAYLTGLVNLLVHAHKGPMTCDLDPRKLTAFTRKGRALRTLSRRVDGTFPGNLNPVSLWEIKEYYHTTTFGSRVADGIYETLLDGLELEELRASESVEAKHYLFLDAKYTWWNCGRSYLCRVIDMLHMGYLDEAIFGSEVVERVPALVAEWIKIANARPI